MIPDKCVHIRYSNAAKMAKRLGMEHAPAITSFQYVKGRFVPTSDGIIMHEADEPLLSEVNNVHS